jgi:hypothetical protein
VWHWTNSTNERRSKLKIGIYDLTICTRYIVQKEREREREKRKKEEKIIRKCAMK